ncbi:rhomboid family intramembrane serine protease [Haloarchaeobius sp. HRN-SO-5]|uniref:rhomboid family intramembrane serine protease n=1 Tax=Haloarchaeobius sp. HRN-SO-5 TaxID=3446118 RepID=UPI003EB8B981
MDLLSTSIAVFVLAVLAGSLGVVAWIDRPGGAWGERLRSRLVMGLPLGTFVVVGFVLAVYLFVQGGWQHWDRPTTLPFRAWSYLYPTGILTAGFSHAGPRHLTGNLIGTLVLSPIAEYAWGHFPRKRGSASFSSWRTNPWVRALVIYPAAVVLLGFVTAAFSIGAVIGFSGVVFAFAGFALVRYPMTTVVAVLGGQRFLSLLYNALQQPILEASATPSPPSPPWWAGIAIQGHALGLFLGFLLGVAVFYRRDDRPSALRVWLAVLFFAVAKNLWAVYWYAGNDEFVLFRGFGVVLVVSLAVVVALALDVRERDFESFTVRTAAVAILVFVAAVTTGPAVYANLTTVSDASVPGDETVEVAGYQVTYAENVRNELIPVVGVDAFGQSTDVSSSGVIVVNQDRSIWYEVVSKGRLAYSGHSTVRVGGIGWRESVGVARDGWSAVGGGTAYRVFLRPPDGAWTLAHESHGATAEPLIAGKSVTVQSDGRGPYQLVVTENGDRTARGPVPQGNGSVSIGGIEFVREQRADSGDRIYAVFGETRVRVFVRETYQ